MNQSPITKENLTFFAILNKLPSCKSRSCKFNKSGECWNLDCYSWYEKEKGSWQWRLCSHGIQDTILSHYSKDGFHHLYKKMNQR